jgi:WD40 repeat protein
MSSRYLLYKNHRLPTTLRDLLFFVFTKMVSPMISFDTQHGDMVHDAQIDYYSRKLATASSDRTVKVWDVVGESYNHAATLLGHDG